MSSEDLVNQQAPQDLLSDEEVLRYTQDKRKSLVEFITKDKMPEDNKDRITLLAALDGMDRAVLSIKKIASKEKSSTADREAQIMIAKIHSSLAGKNPFEASDTAPNGRNLTLDESGMDPLEIAPGETEVGILQETSSQFLERFEKDLPRKTA